MGWFKKSKDCLKKAQGDYIDFELRLIVNLISSNIKKALTTETPRAPRINFYSKINVS